MKLLCLLPVRNGEDDLPGYVESVRGFADGVVALDDGSTDRTRAMLEREPLVSALLANPVRAGFHEWDDSANRNRLLAAAGALDPDWIISLDADERIDVEDGAALRAFLETDALPGLAYSFRWYTMVGDAQHALPEPIWVHRLFAFRPGQTFSSRRLHFAPIPIEIPRRAYVRTTLRIKHLGNLTAERRRARFDKYRQADPDQTFSYEYAQLLDDPADAALVHWPRRAVDAPVLFTGDDAELMPGAIAIAPDVPPRL